MEPDASSFEFALAGNLVHYSAFKHHIGFYPGASGIAAFKDKLSKYKSAKGSAQFPMDQPLPYELISRIVMFRVKENKEKAGGKRQ
ncbi:iron chaperone [Paenibacillus provencensis]|uniref:Iron chaperone n=1 Tax=Paenibacillus provencensis TaxID=441151 RepID=A0ABW3Q1L6_9BACL